MADLLDPIIDQITVDALPIDGNLTHAISSDWAFDHEAGVTGIHGVGASTIASVQNITDHAALATGVHGAGASVLATVLDIATHAALTTGAHGVGAGVIVGTTLAQVLTNKTLTTPVINGDVTTTGLGLPAFTLNGAVTGNAQTITDANITVGAGRTLNVSAGTLTLANDQISGDNVEGGTIAAITITALTLDATLLTVLGAELNLLDLAGLTAGELLVATGAATAAWQSIGVVLDAPDISGVVTAAAPLTFPAFAMAGAIDLATQILFINTNLGILAADGANGGIQIRAGVVAGGSGVLLQLAAHTDGSAFILNTSNVAGNADVSRLNISGGAAIAVGTFANITLTGMVLSGPIDAAGQFVTWTASLDSALVADEVSISGYEIAPGRRALAISTEEPLTVEAVGASDRTLAIRHNGATIKIMCHT